MKYSNKAIESRAQSIATKVVARLNLKGIDAFITGGRVALEVTEDSSTEAFQNFGVSFKDAPIFTIEEWREGHLVFRFPRFSPYRAKVSQESGAFITKLVKDAENRYNSLNKKPEPRKIDIPTLKVYASMPSMVTLRWIFLAFIETLEENQRLRAELSEIQDPQT
jgi:hypothetical protein